jgi:hypothetical protein
MRTEAKACGGVSVLCRYLLTFGGMVARVGKFFASEYTTNGAGRGRARKDIVICSLFSPKGRG